MRPNMTVGPLESLAVEWAVEDPERYHRLSKALVGTQKNADNKDVPNTIITVVLEVPRNLTEQVTSRLRNSPQLRHASYLRLCAEQADDAAQNMDTIVKMRETIKTLEALALHYADKAGKKAEVHKAMDHIRNTIPDHVDKVMKDLRAALDEKRADVAAKLLQAMPDDD